MITKKISRLIPLVILSVAVSCGKPAHPSAVTARNFMDAYYVQADLKQAATYADSLALEKVTTDAQLRDGQAIDASTHHPRISFKLIEEKVEGPSASYFYLLSFKPESGIKTEKKALLRVRERDGGVWKVTQFTDFDAGQETPK